MHRWVAAAGHPEWWTDHDADALGDVDEHLAYEAETAVYTAVPVDVESRPGWQDRSPPEPVSRRWPRHQRRQPSLTVFSQTERTAPDYGGQPGHPTDSDLRVRILAHWLDGWH